MQLAAQELGLNPISNEAVKNIIGLGLPEALKQIYPDLDEQTRVHLGKAYSRFFLSADQDPSNLFDGVEETLILLKDKGYKLTVATGKSRRGLNRILDKMQLTQFFDASRCADETASKPDPMMLNQLLKEFDCDAGAAVMIGDTEYDLDMAARAGMPSIAVSYGAHHVDRLLPYNPVMVLNSFSELLSHPQLKGI